MKNKLIILMIFMFMFSFLIGCTSSSNIKYQRIEGTSEEFSKDVYEVLRGFEEDLKDVSSDNISFRDTSIADKFLNKYKQTILNTKEQKIFNTVEDAIVTVQISTLAINYSRDEHEKYLKKGAEKILQEIEK